MLLPYHHQLVLVVGQEDRSLQTVLRDEHLQRVLAHEQDVAIFVRDAVFEEQLKMKSQV